ncbi:prepilin-type N-terminal cleavage/methylation domain-containing protein [Ferrimonas balearica]|nr:prepilin-type N-terminal cleavage/methylation domain-containing protein [Ferrimonas balearica]
MVHAMKAAQGFSLIEVLIVIAVVSILAVGATLAIGRRERGPESDLTAFLSTLEHLSTRAVLTGRTQALEIGTESFLPARQAIDAVGEATWVAAGPSRHLTGTLRVFPGLGTQSQDGTSRILLLPDQRTSLFDVEFVSDTDSWTCHANGWAPPDCGRDR